MIELKSVHIPDKPYLTKKLEPKTVQKVLGSSVSTVDRLYCITNDCSTKLDLIDQTVEGYTIKMYVKVDYAYAGDARRQVTNIRGWRKLIRRKPCWILRALIEDMSYVTVYKFEHRYTNLNHLHTDIEDQIQNVTAFIETKLTEIL